MAYTSAPTFNSQQLKRVPVEGSQMPLSNLTLGSNYINCHPRKYTQWGTDPTHIVEKRPYLYAHSLSGFSSSAIPRGFYVDPSNQFDYYAQAGSAKSGAVTLGALQYTEGYVSICKYLIDTTQYVVFLENHSSAAYIHYYDTTSTVWTSVSLGTGASGDVIFLDGYLFYASEISTSTPKQRIYNSTIGAPMTWSSGTDYVDAEMYSDKIVGIDKHRNMIVAFGERSMEFFYNNANQYGSPLTRNPSYAQRIGVLRPQYTGADFMHHPPLWASVGDIIYFIGLSSEGTIDTYKLDNFQVTNVSSKFVQRYLNAYETTQANQLTSNNTAMRLHAVNVRGQIGIMISIRRPQVDTDVKIFVYMTDENVWVEWQWLLASGHKLVPWFVQDMNYRSKMICTEYYSSTDHYVVYDLFNYEDANTAGEEVTATVITDTYDFGTDNRKHFRYADVLGDFGSNTITLSYTKSTDYTNYVSMGSISYSSWNKETPVRFRNLGAGPRLGLKLVFTGPGNMMMSGIEVAYNQGQL